jgi:AcrR family transcriptional regulator
MTRRKARALLSFLCDLRYSDLVSGVRERARAATTAEILRLAREQMAAEGAAALSLRAIARDLGMVSSAIYRYFPSRDDLLTALIIDGYDRLGAAVEAADAAVRRRGDFRARFRASAHAIRTWAVEHPSEWSLLFGTPVPGYAAPSDTIVPATRYTTALTGLLADVSAAGHRHRVTVPASMRADLTRLRVTLGGDAPDATLLAGLTAWAAVMGAVNLELFGHLHNVVNEPGALFDAVVEQHARIILGTDPA